MSQTQQYRCPGRPAFEITDAIIVRAEELASVGLTLEQIAHSLGISYDTLNEKRKQFPELSYALKKGQSRGIEAVASVLFDKAMAGDTPCLIFYLKARAGWSDRPQVEADNSPTVCIRRIEHEQRDSK